MIKEIRKKIEKDFQEKNQKFKKTIAVKKVGELLEQEYIYNYYIVYKHCTIGVKIEGFDYKEDMEDKINNLENNVQWLEVMEFKNDIEILEDATYYINTINDFLGDSVDSEKYQIDITYLLMYLITNNNIKLYTGL